MPQPPRDHLRYVCKMPPALFQDYIVTMRPDNPQQAALHILSFYRPGAWGKGGLAERMKRSDRNGDIVQFSGKDIGFQVEGNVGRLQYYGTEFPCLLETGKQKKRTK
ncbi:hypothetical protein [Sphingorhabdus sp. Alg231-15]|uniref:hypothetical protein n=1 Tax=Sphingorhabdus sp. Alg231-15 TaxID=1922222 RepID=UPI00307CA1D3